jgi:hypothetical protein
MNNIKEILFDLGYTNIIENSKEFRTRPIYRDSDNNSALSIKKDTGYFVDFARNISGSFEDLIKLSLNLKTIEEAKEWVSNKYSRAAIQNISKPEIKAQRTFSKDSLAKVFPDHSYWINRGVSEETMQIFQGGVVKDGRMKDRYVFPIFNYEKELIGFAGRDLISSKDSIRPKWKLIGDKSQWKYPLANNGKEIKSSKEVIIVESIGDMLSLWDTGIKNVVVSFGLDISVALINLFLRFDLSKIYISFNNDTDKNSAGNMAADKAEKKLLKYFDAKQVLVSLPIKKDFGEMSKEEILEWKSNLK